MRTMTDLPAMPLWATAAFFSIDPTSVAAARDFTARYLAKTRLTGDHADDVVLAVSEMVTNAIRYGGNGRKNISLDLEIWSKWTLVIVDDRDPQVYAPSSDVERGRGLLIVNAIAERFWWRPLLMSKTANAVILRTGVKLTDEDNKILDDLESGR
jgi:anti-sigma regulatory factor (Ser/Thr protein kinase)